MSGSEDEASIRESLKALQQKLDEKEKRKREEPSSSQLQCPSTPPKKPRLEQSASPRGVNKSPQRVLLGLEKKINAQGVNLGRVVKQGKKQEGSFAAKISSHKTEKARLKQIHDQIKAERMSTFGTISQEEIDLKDNIEYEKYSKLRLSSRSISSPDLEAHLRDKKVLVLPELMAICCPPKFEIPDYINYVVIGVLCKKSDVKFNKAGFKFRNCTLTDFKTDLTLTFRDEAIEEYLPLGEGSIVAILNPGLYVKGNEHGTKTFGLVVGTGENTVIRIGTCKDFGYCKAKTAKGKPCTNHVNLRSQEYCDYHTSLGISRARGKRQELNSAQTKTYNPAEYGQNAQKYSISNKEREKGQKAEPRVDGMFGNQGRVYATVASLGLDESHQPSEKEVAERKAKRAKQIAKEQSIRDKLSKRPEAYLMRNYDAKGNLVQTEQEFARQREMENQPRLFSAEQVRKLGFDPTKQAMQKVNESKEAQLLAQQNRQQLMQQLRGDPNAVQLARPTSTTTTNDNDNDNDSDSDGLEIVY